MADKLPEAMVEIEAVLKKHGISGMIFLADPPTAQVGYHFDEARLCISIAGREISINSAQPDRFHDTASVVTCFASLAERAQGDSETLMIQLSKIRGFMTRIVKEPEPPEPPKANEKPT